MKKVVFILAFLAVTIGSFAQKNIPQPHEVVYRDSIRYMCVGVDEYTYKLVEFTPVDTLNWNNQIVVNHTSPWFNFDNALSDIGFYCGFGCGYNVDKPGAVISMAFDFFGIIYEMNACGRNYGGSLSVGIWNDDRYFIHRFGFNIPVFKNIYVAPMIGIYNYQKGYTDGYDYSFDSNGNIVNSFHCTYSKSSIDYGMRITMKHDLSPYMNISGYVSISNHLTTAGFGLGIKL